ncbi:hypothetical protein Esti_005709 [Eimeria stiedai]
MYEINCPQIQPALEASLVWALHQQEPGRLELKSFSVKAHAALTDERQLKDLFAASDHLINVGRQVSVNELPGRGKEGEYWSPDLTSTTLWQPDFSLLFEWAAEVSVQAKTKKTTTIGCFGNELGMGRIKEAVKEHVKDGDWFACEAPADFTIIATAANLGAYALVAMLAWGAYIAADQQQQQQQQQPMLLLQQHVEAVEQLLPQIWDQAAILGVLTKEAARCGVTARRGPYVCGLTSEDLWKMLTDINRPIRSHFALKARSGPFAAHSEKPVLARDA